MEYVKTKEGKDEEEKREALLKELKSIDADLQKSEGPYVGGNDVNAADLKLGPQLKHVSPGPFDLLHRTHLRLCGVGISA